MALDAHRDGRADGRVLERVVEKGPHHAREVLSVSTDPCAIHAPQLEFVTLEERPRAEGGHLLADQLADIHDIIARDGGRRAGEDDEALGELAHDGNLALDVEQPLVVLADVHGQDVCVGGDDRDGRPEVVPGIDHELPLSHLRADDGRNDAPREQGKDEGGAHHDRKRYPRDGERAVA